MALKKKAGQTLTNSFKGLKDVIPPKVLAKLGFTVTKQANPNDVTPTAISGATQESSCQTDRTDERVKETLILGGTSASFTGAQVTQDLQLATIAEEWGANPTITPVATTVGGEIEDEGNAKMARHLTVGSVLPLYEYTAEKSQLLPEIFHTGTVQTTTEHTETKAAAAPTLTGTQVMAREKQLDAFNTRITVRDEGTIADNTIYTGLEHTQEFGGSTINVTQDKRGSSVFNPALDVNTVEARSIPIGGGKYLHERKDLASGSHWPTLQETPWDDFANIQLLVRKTVKAVGTVTSELSGGVLTEEKQIDDLHTLEIITQPGLTAGTPSTPATQTIPITVTVSRPPIMSGNGEVNALSGAVVDYGYKSVLTQKSGEWPGNLVRVFYPSLAAALTAASTLVAGSLLRFTTRSEVYCNTNEVTTLDANPNFLGYAQVYQLHIPEHLTSADTGTFIKTVQVQPWKFGFWVVEHIEVTLS